MWRLKRAVPLLIGQHLRRLREIKDHEKLEFVQENDAMDIDVVDSTLKKVIFVVMDKTILPTNNWINFPVRSIKAIIRETCM